MVTFTRDELYKKYTENQRKIMEKKIQTYVTKIQDKILLMNNKGHTTLSYPFYKYGSENIEPEMIKEIGRRLQEVFIDSCIEFQTSHEGNKLVIDWIA
jgi:ribosomal protein S17E